MNQYGNNLNTNNIVNYNNNTTNNVSSSLNRKAIPTSKNSLIKKNILSKPL